MNIHATLCRRLFCLTTILCFSALAGANSKSLIDTSSQPKKHHQSTPAHHAHHGLVSLAHRDFIEVNQTIMDGNHHSMEGQQLAIHSHTNSGYMIGVMYTHMDAEQPLDQPHQPKPSPNHSPEHSPNHSPDYSPNQQPDHSPEPPPNHLPRRFPQQNPRQIQSNTTANSHSLFEALRCNLHHGQLSQTDHLVHTETTMIHFGKMDNLTDSTLVSTMLGAIYLEEHTMHNVIQKTGGLVSVGVRHWFNEDWDLDTRIVARRIEKEDTGGVTVNLQYRLSEAFSLGLHYRYIDQVPMFGGGVRYHF